MSLNMINRKRLIRKNRVRSTVSGTQERPRLSVSISGRNVTAQVIDDTSHKTLVYVSTVGEKLSDKNMTDKAAHIGKQVAVKSKSKKITKVAFDRGFRKYHGRIKALADAARENGLEF